MHDGIKPVAYLVRRTSLQLGLDAHSTHQRLTGAGIHLAEVLVAAWNDSRLSLLTATMMFLCMLILNISS
jgi:hypothetical protein